MKPKTQRQRIVLAYIAFISFEIFALGFIYANRSQLIQRMRFINRIKKLADSNTLEIYSYEYTDTDDWKWIYRATISDPNVFRDVAADLSHYGLWRCYPWPSKCSFWIKCDFRRGDKIETVYLGIDGCRQFHFKDWLWQGTFHQTTDSSIDRFIKKYSPRTE